jgi:hypothetical protein
MKTCRFPLWPHKAKPTHEYCKEKPVQNLSNREGGANGAY